MKCKQETLIAETRINRVISVQASRELLPAWCVSSHGCAPLLSYSLRYQRLISVLLVDAQFQKEEIAISRDIGDRYRYEQCGAELVYEKPCLYDESQPHSEICCGE